MLMQTGDVGITVCKATIIVTTRHLIHRRRFRQDPFTSRCLYHCPISLHCPSIYCCLLVYPTPASSQPSAPPHPLLHSPFPPPSCQNQPRYTNLSAEPPCSDVALIWGGSSDAAFRVSAPPNGSSTHRPPATLHCTAIQCTTPTSSDNHTGDGTSSHLRTGIGTTCVRTGTGCTALHECFLFATNTRRCAQARCASDSHSPAHTASAT